MSTNIPQIFITRVILLTKFSMIHPWSFPNQLNFPFFPRMQTKRLFPYKLSPLMERIILAQFAQKRNNFRNKILSIARGGTSMETRSPNRYQKERKRAERGGGIRRGKSKRRKKRQIGETIREIQCRNVTRNESFEGAHFPGSLAGSFTLSFPFILPCKAARSSVVRVKFEMQRISKIAN